ncbi:MAG: PHP domain-containing protein [Candidatus Aenigmatarchaeota archaeon]
MKFELHCHSHYSRGKKIPVEGLDSPSEIVKFAKKSGIDGIALTDHYTNKGWKEAKEACRKNGLVFVPAIEISSIGGHIIGLGLNDFVQSGLSVEETLEKIQEQGAVSVAAHPFDIRREGLKERSVKADVIEVFNSMNLDRFSNYLAKKLAEKMEKPFVSGSDAHTKEMLGASINYVDGFDVESVLKEIRKGRARFFGRYMDIEKLLPWVKKRMLMSYGEILKYADANYPEPKRWVSKRLLHSFVSSKREGFWYILGEAGLAGARAYGFLKML